MRKIDKGLEPKSLADFKKTSQNKRSINYQDLPMEVRQDIRTACLAEQYYLCAYCCKSIENNNAEAVNEHVVSRQIAPSLALDFTNIVASCTTKGQCDASHGSQAFGLTPLMVECETELIFKVSGVVEGTTERAKQTIEVLNLGDSVKTNRKLVATRHQVAQALLWRGGIFSPDDMDIAVEDDAFLQDLIADLCQPQNGKLQPYAPVAINIIKNWINS